MRDALKSIGFSEGDVTVFETLVKHGEQTILELSKSATMNRSYCYELLERLQAKGLITKQIVNNKTYWKAMPRESILAYLDEVKKQVDESLRAFSERFRY